MVPFRLARGIATSAVILSASITFAETTVCPSANTAVSGNAGLNIALRNLSRTHQIVIAASELAGLPNGTVISGLTYRLQPAQASSYPAAGVTLTFADYTIELAGAATTPAAMSTTLADNIGPNPITVRTGPLAIAPLAFSNAGNPTAFGWTLDFTTNFIYTGGDLVVTIRHSGNQQNVNSFLDCLTSAPPGPGYGIVIRAMTGGSAAATVGVEAAATIVRLTHCGPLPCRGDVNGDLVRNGLDVQAFAASFIPCAAGAHSYCASCQSSDVNGDGAINSADVAAIADLLLTDQACA